MSPQLHSIIASLHEDMQGVVSFDGKISEPFAIHSGVKQGCVLAPTLFVIFVSLLLNHAFKHSTEGIHLHNRSHGKLLNLAQLRTKSKVRTVLIRELLFADDAALTTHKEEELQQLISQFSHTCKEFGLTISIRKTEVMGQDVPSPHSITIDNQVLDVADHFTYLGCIISSNRSLGSEINKHIAKAVSVMARLSRRVWFNKQLTSNTKLQVYQACVLSTLLYGSESWTTYARQENRLESLHFRCLCCILGITWQDKVTNTAVLGCAGSHSIHLLLCQRRLHWFGNMHRMGDGRITKDVLYGELATGHHLAGCPALRFRDVCKRDLKLADIDPGSWQQLADDRSTWQSVVQKGVRTDEDKQDRLLEDKRQYRKDRQESLDSNQPSSFRCTTCCTETATRGLDLSVTPDAAPNKIDDQTHDVFHYVTR